MNNINIKSKKTKTLNGIYVLPRQSREDSLYANIFTLLASKQTEIKSRSELKRTLASLYDVSSVVANLVDSNALIIQYSMSYIQDQYLPESITQQCEELFDEVLACRKFTEDEVQAACSEICIHIRSAYENKQTVAMNILKTNIDTTGYALSEEEIYDFYENVNYDKFTKWINRIDDAEYFRFDINNGEENIVYGSANFAYDYKSYNAFERIEKDLGLDQAYISIGYKLESIDVVNNNLATMIFGSDVYSKLFKEVRERLSLSYNIRASLTEDNLIIVYGGVNKENVEVALDEIDKQLKKLCDGYFENELELAKVNYIERLERGKSNERSKLNLYLRNYLKAKQVTDAEVIEQIKKVKKNDLTDVFQNMEKIGCVIVK